MSEAAPLPAPTPQVRELVGRLMAESGLRPPDDELESFAKSYVMLRAGIESLYAIPEARYEDPALVFRPDPSFEDWGR